MMIPCAAAAKRQAGNQPQLTSHVGIWALPRRGLWFADCSLILSNPELQGSCLQLPRNPFLCVASRHYTNHAAIEYT